MGARAGKQWRRRGRPRHHRAVPDLCRERSGPSGASLGQRALASLPHRHVDIPKRKGGSRRLTIPSIADRVLHTALAQVLTPILDPMFEEGSYAYRPGRSVQQAVREIDRLRKAGYWHVIEADIVGFFDNVRHDLALAKLEAALSRHPGGARIVALVGHILEHQSQESGDHGRGLAQGSPLSPLLANLYLHDLDEAIEGQGIRIIRFADDFVVLCRRRESAVAAFHRCASHSVRSWVGAAWRGHPRAGFRPWV